MGQAEIVKCLEKSTEPLSRLQIAEELGDEVVKISHTIKKMLMNETVKCIELDRFQAAKKLGFNKPSRRTRFYYL